MDKYVKKEIKNGMIEATSIGVGIGVGYTCSSKINHPVAGAITGSVTSVAGYFATRELLRFACNKVTKLATDLKLKHAKCEEDDSSFDDFDEYVDFIDSEIENEFDEIKNENVTEEKPVSEKQESVLVILGKEFPSLDEALSFYKCEKQKDLILKYLDNGLTHDEIFSSIVDGRVDAVLNKDNKEEK